MQLTILERLLLLQALPQKGNIITLRIVSDLRRNLSLTEQEIKDNHVRQEAEKMLWDNDTATFEISIGEKATDVIVESLKRMNETQELTEQYIPLYERFVEKRSNYVADREQK